jgi:hypothetical protein
MALQSYCKSFARLYFLRVGQHHDSRRDQNLLQKMGVKHHRQGFTAALGMPEHAVRGGRLCGGSGGFPHGEILVIRAKDFCIAGKADEVFNDVEQPRLVEDALNKIPRPNALNLTHKFFPNLL